MKTLLTIAVLALVLGGETQAATFKGKPTLSRGRPGACLMVVSTLISKATGEAVMASNSCRANEMLATGEYCRASDAACFKPQGQTRGRPGGVTTLGVPGSDVTRGRPSPTLPVCATVMVKLKNVETGEIVNATNSCQATALLDSGKFVLAE